MDVSWEGYGGGGLQRMESGAAEGCSGRKFFFLTMFRQQSQYDSRLRFSSRVLVRVSVMVRLGLGLELVIWLWLGLWLWFRVRVRVKVIVRVRVGFMVRVRVGVRVRIMVNLTLTLTKTLELNLNRLSYWDCCRNMVRQKNLRSGHLAVHIPQSQGG